MDIPSRSKLYRIQPHGLKSPYIESLTSYIKRHAAVLQVPTGVFIKTVLSKEIDQEYLSLDMLRGSSRLYQRAATINGTHQLATVFSSLMERLTTIPNLVDLTLLNWNGRISTLNLFKPSLSWCPSCFDEWIQERTELYEPLYWFINGIHICQTHLCYLVDSCPHCLKSVPILSHYSNVGFCNLCKESLCHINPDVTQPNCDEIKVSNNIFQLLFCQRRDTPNSIIQNWITLRWNGCLSLASLDTNIDNSTLWDWYTDKFLIPIPRLHQFLLAALRTTASTVSQVQQEDNQVPPKKRQTVLGEFDSIKSILLNCLLAEPPLSLEATSVCTTFSKKTLKKHFPELTKQIKDRYARFKSDRAILRIERLSNEVRQAVYEITVAGEYPSARTIEKHLNKPGLLIRVELRISWRDAKYQLGLDDKGVFMK